MYIHSYQINNVLNVYRKQLSRTTIGSNNRPATIQSPKDQVKLSDESQRRSIIDKVSAEIVDRMAHNSPQSQFGKIVNEKLNAHTSMAPNHANDKREEFTYTAIDENNHKIINTLSINEFRHSIDGNNEIAGGGIPQ